MFSKFVSWLEGLDRWTLAKVESFSHKVQATTGLTNFWLARSIVLVDISHEMLDKRVAGTIIMTFVFLFTFLYERDTQKRLEQGFKNELAKTVWAVVARVFLLIVSLINVFSVVLLSLFVLTLSAAYPKETIGLVAKLFELWAVVPLSLLPTGFWYLLSVTPMPPGPSRLRKWIASLGRKKATSVA